MLEVPGMTRPALDAMSAHDVARMRWGLFARALAPAATVDYDAMLASIAAEEAPPSSAAMKTQRGVRREQVMQAKLEQARLRGVLLLDDEDEDDAGG